MEHNLNYPLKMFLTFLLETASAYIDSDKVPESSVVEIISSHMSIITASRGTPLSKVPCSARGRRLWGRGLGG